MDILFQILMFISIQNLDNLAYLLNIITSIELTIILLILLEKRKPNPSNQMKIFQVFLSQQ